MLRIIVAAAGYSMRHPWRVIAVGIVIAALSGAYVSQRFAVDTDINDLISRDLPWREREIDYQKAFPKSMDLILVVVEAPNLKTKRSRLSRARRDPIEEAGAVSLGRRGRRRTLFRKESISFLSLGSAQRRHVKTDAGRAARKNACSRS